MYTKLEKSIQIKVEKKNEKIAVQSHMWGCAENDTKQGKVKVFTVKYNGNIKSSQKQSIISLTSHLQTQPLLAIGEKAT